MLKTIKRNLAQKLSNTKFGIQAVQEKADLSAFKQRPSFKVSLGIVLIGLSYIIGWPAISVLGVVVYKYDLPLRFIAAGGPVLYVISHLIFLLGVYLAGANYEKVLMKWVVRKVIERYNGDEAGNL